LLPLGTYFNKTGAKRRSASTQWFGQYATRWQPKEATYADANGDGIANQADVNVIGLNWGKQHSLSMPQLLPRELREQGVLRPVVRQLSGSDKLCIEIVADSLDELTGAAFELAYPAGRLCVLAVERGKDWGQNTLLIYKDDGAQGKIGVGVCQTAKADAGANPSVVAVVHFAWRERAETTRLRFQVKDALATNQVGRLFRLAGAAWGSEVAEAPTAFSLQQNYPNPFNPSTRLEYALPHAAHITIKIHDALGREIATLVDEKLPAGSHFVAWDGKDRTGREMPSGIYFVRMQAEGFVRTMKAVKVK
jgi:hypothetical protein